MVRDVLEESVQIIGRKDHLPGWRRQGADGRAHDGPYFATSGTKARRLVWRLLECAGNPAVEATTSSTPAAAERGWWPAAASAWPCWRWWSTCWAATRPWSRN